MGAIRVSNVGKAYKQYPRRWDRLAEWRLPGHRPRHTLTWVLQNVSFPVASGEAVGIVGVTWAGKSTLLAALARCGIRTADVEDPAEHEGHRRQRAGISEHQRGAVP